MCLGHGWLPGHSYGVSLLSYLIFLLSCFDRREPLTPNEVEDSIANQKSNALEVNAALIAAKLPPVRLPEEDIRSFDLPQLGAHGYEFSTLVALRRLHETKCASRSMRTSM